VIADATAVVVAGGAGRRLGGASKAFLELGGKSILQRQLDVLRPLFAQVLVAAPDPAPFAPLGLRAVPDLVPDRGAPGGVHAALTAISTGWAFCVACDMPFLRPEPIELLASKRFDADAVVPVRAGFLEPLFAFYNARLHAPFSQALPQGNPSLARLLEACRLVRVAEAELAAVDPGLSALENVNTPEELDRARVRARGEWPDAGGGPNGRKVVHRVRSCAVCLGRLPGPHGCPDGRRTGVMPFDGPAIRRLTAAAGLGGAAAAVD